MKVVWLIRHGESESNVGIHTTQPTELTQLTRKGQQQAISVAAVVSKPDLIVTSPYLRTKQTAQPTIERFPNCPQTEWQVQEFDYIAPPLQPVDRPGILALCKEYWQRRDPFYQDGVGAESFASLIHRVDLTFKQIEQSATNTILVFTHSGFIRAVLWSTLMSHPEVTPRSMDKFYGFISSISIPNGAIVKLHLGEDGICFSPVLTNHLQRFSDE